jgi:FMN reductase
MPIKTVVVAGNPKPQSRTLDAGLRLAGRLGAEDPAVIDVTTLGSGLLGWGDENVAAAVDMVSSAELAIFASPTYKATYTGLLKLFLDQFAGGSGLQGVTALPLMLGAGPAHAMAAELHLKPVLVELGATCPAPAIYQLDRSYIDDPALDAWCERWAPVITTLTTAPARSL